MDINKIYVISLNASDEATQKNIIDRLNNCQFTEGTPFEIVQAFDGRGGDIPEDYKTYEGWKLEDSWNDWWNRDMTPGEVGCAISHRIVWERIVTEGVNGRALVLEDDFLCNGGLSDLPEPSTDWEIALLGRQKIEADIEEPVVDATWCRPRHFYNMHAYVLNVTPDGPLSLIHI